MRFRALAVVFAPPNVVHASEYANKPPPSIVTLVQQLSDEDFDVREAASRYLKAMGEAIIPELECLRDENQCIEAKARLGEIIWPCDPSLIAVVTQSVFYRTAPNQNPILLDGRPSLQANSTTDLTFTWHQISGHNVNLRTDTRRQRVSISNRSMPPGIYHFGLVVSQGRKHSKPALVIVVVNGTPAYFLREIMETNFALTITEEMSVEFKRRKETSHVKQSRYPDEPEE